jgi:hypothetical protein
MHLTVDQRKIVLDVLKQFVSVDALAAFLFDKLTRVLNDIVDDNLHVSRSAVVRDAERAEWILDLIQALDEVSTPPLKAKLATIGTIEELREERFFDDCYPKGEPLVDRAELRKNLRAAQAEDAKRILLIHSDRRYSGKSHSRRHIRHVATTLGIRLAEIEMRGYAAGEEVQPSDFGPEIAFALDQPLQAQLDPKMARWSINFLAWLEKKLAAADDNRLWIVFDDFEKEKLRVSLPDSVHEFIQLLAERVANRLFGVRLFLINYDGVLPSELGFQLVRQPVPEIQEKDIAFFFLDFYRNHLPPTDREAAALDSAQRARAVMARIRKEEKPLESMRGALREECDALKEKSR